MPNFASAVQLNRIPILGIVPEKNAVAPLNPVSGQMWTDTSGSTPKLKWYDGTQWVAADYSSMQAGYITDTMINAAAGIQLSKLAINPVARANHTGTQLAATISDFDTQARTSRLDQFAVPTANVDLNGNRLINVAAPSLGTDAANKNYVDNARAGIAVKDPVRVATMTNVNLASPGTSIDSIAMVVGDRFLAAGQSTATQNGIYVYNGASTAATRTPDASAAGQVFDGSMTAVAEGSYAGYQYIQTATASGAPGSWTQTWVVFQTGGQTYVAGNGLTLTGTTFALTAPVSIANGGTGSATAVAARTALGAVGKFATTITSAITAGVATTIVHNLNTLDVSATFRTLSDGKVIYVDFTIVDVNTLSFTADIGFAGSALRIVVIG